MSRTLLIPALAAALAGACGDDDTHAADAATDHFDARVVDAPTIDYDSFPAVDATPGPDGSGGTCGGFMGEVCPGTEWCDYPDGQCGAADGQGTCKTRPTDCPPGGERVCACDGNVYASACAAQAAGFDLSDLAGCAPPTGTFSCGWRFCTQGAEYCEVFLSDVIGWPNDYNCKPLPAGCSPHPTCACLSGVTCGGSCTENLTGDLTATCYGG